MAFSRCGAFTVGKGWRRTIGVKVGIGGRLMPCRFWLGMDKPKATAKALAIESLWVGLNEPYWSPEALRAAEAVRVGATAEKRAECVTAALASRPSPTVKSVLTFGGMIDRYRQARLNEVGLSIASKNAISCRTKTLERSTMIDEPLEAVDAEELAKLVSHWLNRPKHGKGEQISEFSSRMIVKTARAVFDYADSIEVWDKPRRFDRLFRLPRASSAPTIQTYSVDELSRLHRAANERMRLFILLSLNCGFCSAELASLKRCEIDLRSKRITRPRQKNGVMGSWNLWNETATALRRGMQTDGELALMEDGKPLVLFSENHLHRHDIFPNRWTRLRVKAEIDHGSFKTLRKTGATMIRSIGGIEVSEQYLAHSEKSMARYYSVPDQNHLNDALAEMRKRLAPMFKAK